MTEFASEAPERVVTAFWQNQYQGMHRVEKASQEASTQSIVLQLRAVRLWARRSKLGERPNLGEWGVSLHALVVSSSLLIQPSF